jgi:hypothetical protein
MQAKRYIVPALFLVLLALVLTGCNRSANAPNSDGQASTSQNSADAAATDNNNAANQGAATPTNNAGKNYAANGAQTASNPAPQPMVIPAGTSITVRLQEGLSSKSAVPGERFDAVVDEPIVLADQSVIPVGTPVTGHVTVARHSGRLHHPGEIGLTLDTMVINNQQLRLTTSHIVARGGSHKKRNWGWIGGGTGGGALIGALAAGGKGALIGGGIGAAAGTTTAFLTGKKDVGFGAERRLRFRLSRDISLTA